MASPACSYAHKECVQQGWQLVHLSPGCYSGQDDRGGIKVEGAVESQGKDRLGRVINSHTGRDPGQHVTNSSVGFTLCQALS